jgi:hypothetical protein
MSKQLLVRIDSGESYPVDIRKYGDMSEYLNTPDDRVAAGCAQQIITEGYHVEICPGQIVYYPVHRIQDVIVQDAPETQ